MKDRIAFSRPVGNRNYLQNRPFPIAESESFWYNHDIMAHKDILLLVSPAATPCLKGITRFAHDHGWFITIDDREHPPHDWHGDGVLATIGKGRNVLIDFVRRSCRNGVPVVDLTNAEPSLRIPRVCGDNLEMGRLAADHFQQRGFHRAAWFSSKWSNVQQLRLQGLIDNGYPDAVVLVGLDRTQLAQRLAALKKPTAVFAYSDNDASRVLNACRDTRISVPEEIAILGVDNNELICLHQPTPLSSIRHDLERVGYEGAALLHQLIETRQTKGAEPILIPPCGIVVRQSTQIEATDNPLLRKAYDLIRHDFSRSLGINQLADELGVSRRELNRVAHDELGHSLADEIIRQRLARVKVLLAETNWPLRAVAAETGFCHAAHLVNAFRAAFGRTPGDYRRNIQGEERSP